jgi:uncharacterized membrane protein
MSLIERRLGTDVRAKLEAAVREAETHTTAELAVFVRDSTSWKARLRLPVPHTEVRAAAQRLFIKSGLDQTKARNAVMVYVSLLERSLVVLGDEGIHARLGSQAWEALVAEALTAAKKSSPLEGVCLLITHLGQMLAQHFPKAADDVNELPDAPDVR